MAGPATIRFDDGAGYEQGMGVWSRLAGEVFLDWLVPAPGLRWADIGCGNGAFTAAMMQRCTPDSVVGIDPSASQLDYARNRPDARGATFQQGDAQALPFAHASVDAAVMALVLFFVPDPDRGVAEMRRVVRPGGLVAAYVWDILGGGFPFHAVQEEVRALGITPPLPPSVAISRAEALRACWETAGLEAIATRAITVERTFADFETFWSSIGGSPGTRAAIEQLSSEQVATLRDRMRARLPADTAGRIVCAARANAIRGFVPG